MLHVGWNTNIIRMNIGKSGETQTRASFMNSKAQQPNTEPIMSTQHTQQFKQMVFVFQISKFCNRELAHKYKIK